jgi:hypothetical protein
MPVNNSEQTKNANGNKGIEGETNSYYCQRPRNVHHTKLLMFYPNKLTNCLCKIKDV